MNSLSSCFVKDGIIIQFQRNHDNFFELSIRGDYVNSARKSRLGINTDSFTNTVSNFWNSIKNKVVIGITVFFDEIDYYDDMTDIYETPLIMMEKGKSKPIVRKRQHGSIPKDWGIVLVVKISKIKSSKIVMDIINNIVSCGPSNGFNKTDVNRFKKCVNSIIKDSESVSVCELYNEY